MSGAFLFGDITPATHLKTLVLPSFFVNIVPVNVHYPAQISGLRPVFVLYVQKVQLNALYGLPTKRNKQRKESTQIP